MSVTLCVRVISYVLASYAGTVGTITLQPENVESAIGETATFTCEAFGNVAWSINGELIDTKEEADVLAEAGIYTPLPTPSKSTVTIKVYESLNETKVGCLVMDPDNPDDVLSMSDTAKLLVKSAGT